jgi:membrane protein implicated in regulation of membrane protease activity
MQQETVLRLQGAFELSALVLYFGGYFGEAPGIMYLGGAMLVLDIATTIWLRVLSPVYPVTLAVLLSLVFTPWYQGVFWACAIFTLLGSPNSVRKLLSPEKVLKDYPEQEQ